MQFSVLIRFFFQFSGFGLNFSLQFLWFLVGPDAPLFTELTGSHYHIKLLALIPVRNSKWHHLNISVVSVISEFDVNSIFTSS